MSLFRVFQSINNDVWALQFVNDPAYLTEGDKKAMRQFGEPEVELGGTFLADTENEFVLPTKKAKVRADFPYTQYFDARDAAFEDATQTKVEAYRDAIMTRITTAFTDLREMADTFTGERTYNI